MENPRLRAEATSKFTQPISSGFKLKAVGSSVSALYFLPAAILQDHPKSHLSPDREVDPSLTSSHFTLSSFCFLFFRPLGMEFGRVCCDSLALFEVLQQACILSPCFKGVTAEPQGDSQLGELEGSRHLTKHWPESSLAFLEMQVVSGLPSSSPAQGHLDLRAILTSDPVQVGGQAGYWAVACKLCLALQSFCALLSSTPCLGPLLGNKVTSAGCQDPMTTPESLLNFPWLRPWNFSSHSPLFLCLPEA